MIYFDESSGHVNTFFKPLIDSSCRVSAPGSAVPLTPVSSDQEQRTEETEREQDYIGELERLDHKYWT